MKDAVRTLEFRQNSGAKSYLASHLNQTVPRLRHRDAFPTTVAVTIAVDGHELAGAMLVGSRKATMKR